jgi:hypothetical protein
MNPERVPMSMEGIKHTITTHKCDPLVMVISRCPCNESCAVICPACKDILTFSGNRPYCDHLAEALDNTIIDWWGYRGEGTLEIGITE